MCDVDSQCAALRQVPIGAPPSPPAGHRLPAPTAWQLNDPLVREGPQEDTMREHRNHHPRREILLCGGRGAATQEAVTQSGDVCDDDRRRRPETGRAAEDLA